MEQLGNVAYVLFAAIYFLAAVLALIWIIRNVWHWLKTKRTRPRWTVR